MNAGTSATASSAISHGAYEQSGAEADDRHQILGLAE
jgi:hypothetical protein